MRKAFFRKFSFLVLIFLSAYAAMSQDAATLIEVSGKVTNQEREPIPDVSVQLKGTVAGTITDKTGEFKLRTKTKLPFTLVFSSIGFQQQEFQVASLGSNL